MNSLNLTPPAPDPIIVHPGVVVAMLHLLPSIYHVQETQVTYTVGKTETYMEIVFCCICSSKKDLIFLCVRQQDCQVIILFFVLSISDSILWHSSIYHVFHSVRPLPKRWQILSEALTLRW